MNKLKQTFTVLVYSFMTLLGCMWLARMIVLLRMGQMHDMFNELIMAVLCVLVFLLGQRLERMGNTNALLAEKMEEHLEHNDKED